MESVLDLLLLMSIAKVVRVVTKSITSALPILSAIVGFIKFHSSLCYSSADLNKQVNQPSLSNLRTLCLLSLERKVGSI